MNGLHDSHHLSPDFISLACCNDKVQRLPGRNRPILYYNLKSLYHARMSMRLILAQSLKRIMNHLIKVTSMLLDNLKYPLSNNFIQLIGRLRVNFFQVLSPICFVVTLLPFAVHGQASINPTKGNHIVFVGNTFAERIQYFNYFEPLLYKSFPESELTVRNMGWSADEVDLQPRPYNFGSTDEYLRKEKADIIFACFGMNESFKGGDSASAFKEKLIRYVSHLTQTKYNGRTSPLVILVSPIAHENLGGHLPDPQQHNENLRLYTSIMQDVASAQRLLFIDLFSPTLQLMKSEHPLTLNGIHLNDKGYRAISQIMANSLSLPVQEWKDADDFTTLKKVIDSKNQHFFYKFRAVNSEYIRGSRKEPWVQPQDGPISYPSEFRKLDKMIRALDSLVWSACLPNHMDDRALQRVINDGSAPPINQGKPSVDAPLAEQFIMKKGFKIELFASEKDFPIEKPVKITFDPKGRLWVSTLPSYPQYLPGNPPNDKIIILEDTNRDGKADKHIVFADSLYMPLGFELGHGGAFVTEAPDLLFLKDSDGDGKADSRERLLHGFGTEDSHHSISAHAWGPDGGLYMHTGTFLHTQVETPYGPVRSAYGETWRYEPKTMKLEAYISYPYANPWGNAFMRDGTHLIGDVSSGMNYFAPPLTVAIDYPFKHQEMKDFLTSKVRPKTCGMEIISSRHFPDSMQGDILFNTFLGFQGVRQHNIYEKGSGIIATETEPLMRSSDARFRPVDLQFGPDGALYVVDWYNPVINHGERALRDPKRDKTHGRIWRITCTSKKLLEPVDMTGLTIPDLLNCLKAYEDRTRYRARIQLSMFEEAEVIKSVEHWKKQLDTRNQNYEYYKLEALWIHQQFNQPDTLLLTELLHSRDHHIRAAATKVIVNWKEHMTDAQQTLKGMSKDSSQRVRLEAIAGLSHFRNETSVRALLEAAMLPTDDYIAYALKEAFKHLKPVWIEMFKNDNQFLATEPYKARLLLHPLSSEEMLKLPGYFLHDPEAGKYIRRPLSDHEYRKLANVIAVSNFRKKMSIHHQLSAKKTHILKESGVMKTIHIGTVFGKMAFDKASVTAKKGSVISIVFSNTDEMPHNLVVIKPGSTERVGKAADAMASDNDGYAKNFVPDVPEIIAATPLLNRNKTFRLKFRLPSVKGDYPFLCTFPGHWRIMKGVLRVTD